MTKVGCSNSEEQLYACLSEVLSLVRNKFKGLLRQELGMESEEGSVNQELVRCLGWFRRINVREGGEKLVSIMVRFMSRVKEMLGGVFGMVPKNKVQLMVTFRKLQILANKPLTLNNAAVLISSLIEVVIRSTVSRKELIIASEGSKRTVQPRAIQPVAVVQVVEAGRSESRGTPRRKVSEVQNIMNAIKMYGCVEVDSEYVRGLYFDLKERRSTIEEEMRQRNSCAQGTISLYCKRYKNSGRKGRQQRVQGGNLKEKSISQKEVVWEINASDFNQSNLMSVKKQANSSKRKIMSARSTMSKATVTSFSAEKSIDQFQSCRGLQEQCRQISSAKERVSYITINAPENGNRVDINNKRRQFYKRSQEQLKHRYKYMFRKQNPCNLSALAGIKNPQFIYQTILYK